jgi:hypothetical protein
MRLWSSPDQRAANLADSLGNAQSMPRQIDPADLQRRQLAPPETVVRQQQDGDSVVAGRLGQSIHFLMAQEPLLCYLDLR